MRTVFADIERPSKEAFCNWWAEFFRETYDQNKHMLVGDLGVNVLATLDAVAEKSPKQRWDWYNHKAPHLRDGVRNLCFTRSAC